MNENPQVVPSAEAMTELAQLQSQMQVVISTMSRLSETTDASLGRISELEEMRKAVTEMKGHVEQHAQTEMQRAVAEMKAYITQQPRTGAFRNPGMGAAMDDDKPLINPTIYESQII